MYNWRQKNRALSTATLQTSRWFLNSNTTARKTRVGRVLIHFFVHMNIINGNLTESAPLIKNIQCAGSELQPHTLSVSLNPSRMLGQDLYREKELTLLLQDLVGTFPSITTLLTDTALKAGQILSHHLTKRFSKRTHQSVSAHFFNYTHVNKHWNRPRWHHFQIPMSVAHLGGTIRPVYSKWCRVLLSFAFQQVFITL